MAYYNCKKKEKKSLILSIEGGGGDRPWAITNEREKNSLSGLTHSVQFTDKIKYSFH